MTINLANNNPRIEYAVAQGLVQTVFTVPFEYFEDSDVSIYVDGVKKSLGADYTLSGGDGSTGVLTFVTATPPAVQQITGATGGSQVAIVREVALERTTDFSSSGYINRVSLNSQLDTIVAQMADLNDRVSRSIHLNDYVIGPDMLLTDDRKAKILSFNESTGAVETTILASEVAGAAEQAIIATQQAVIATTKAEEAAASQADAIVSKDAAAVSQSAAASSATGAASSASTATTKASDASTSASESLASKDAAESAEATATTKAGEASTSASTATTKASESLTSAGESATSASASLAAKDAALAALDSFDDRYLGQKATAPTTDNDGDPLQAGMLYFNTTTDDMFVYDGSAWVAAYASLEGVLLKANNLSDLVSPSTARTNLDVDQAGDALAFSIALG